MAFIPTTGVCKVELLWTLRTQRLMNQLFVMAPGDIGIPYMEDLATFVNEQVEENWLQMVATDVSYRGCRIISQNTATAPLIEDLLPEAAAGTHTGVSLPNQVTWVVKFLTNLRGRSARGRNYVPGVPRDAVTGNTVGEAYANAWLATYGEFKLQLEAATLGTWGIVSYWQDNVQRSSGFFQTITEPSYTDLQVDTMRKRLPREAA